MDKKYKFITQYDIQKQDTPEDSGKFPSVIEPGARGVDIPSMLDLFEKTKDLNILGFGTAQRAMSEEEQQEFLRSDSALNDPVADAIDVFAELQEQQGLDSLEARNQALSYLAEQNIAQQSKEDDTAVDGYQQGVPTPPNGD